MKSIKRRDVLKGALAGAAVGVAPFNILKAGTSPNNKLNIACIGVGGMGSMDAYTLSRTDNVIALCDVDVAWHKKRSARFKNLQEIKLWTDYRVMFDKIGKQIDAVCIGTPEHAHYAISMYAIRRYGPGAIFPGRSNVMERATVAPGARSMSRLVAFMK